MLGWGLATVVGFVAAVLVAPRLFLSPIMMSPVLIYALAAATLGGWDSPIGAVVGGLLIGVVESVGATFLPFIGAELRLVIPIAVTLVVLLVRPAACSATDGGAGMRTHASSGERVPHPRRSRRRACSPALPAAAAVVPAVPGSLALTFAMAILGLNLLLGYAGQVCLAQGALFACGAYTTAILVPTTASIRCSPCPPRRCVTALAGVVIGLPALRLGGLQLAIVTFGVAAVVPQLHPEVRLADRRRHRHQHRPAGAAGLVPAAWRPGSTPCARPAPAFARRHAPGWSAATAAARCGRCATTR